MKLRVLSGGATQGLVEALRPAFETASGCRIDGTFGAVGALRDRVLAGEPADLLVLSRAVIDELVRQGHVDARSITDLGAVVTALAVRQHDPVPAIATADELRSALSAADTIHFPDPERATAGIHFARVIAQLGLAEDVRDRLRPAPNGATAMRALAASTSHRPVGCTQATEILATPGLVLVAPLPADCALTTTYTAAVAAKAALPVEAARLVAMLGDRAAGESRRRLGFT